MGKYPTAIQRFPGYYRRGIAATLSGVVRSYNLERVRDIVLEASAIQLLQRGVGGLVDTSDLVVAEVLVVADRGILVTQIWRRC